MNRDDLLRLPSVVSRKRAADPLRLLTVHGRRLAVDLLPEAQTPEQRVLHERKA